MTARRRLSKAQVEALIEEAIVDAYGDSEQRVGFLCMLQEHLACPFTRQVLGDSVTIDRIDLNDADEIIAICRRQHHRQPIPILDLPLPTPPPSGWQWIEAYRYWRRGGR